LERREYTKFERERKARVKAYQEKEWKQYLRDKRKYGNSSNVRIYNPRTGRMEQGGKKR
jgi:hypothetical protein